MSLGGLLDLARPYAAICPTLEGEILVTLARTTRPLTGREVARLVRHGSQTGINRALQRLVEHGVVLRQQAGRAMLVLLNRDHLSAPAVELLSSMRERLTRKLVEECEAWRVPAKHVSLFGSAARGDGDTESDVDLFIVRPRRVDENDATWRTQLEQLAQGVESWTGNRAGLSEVSEKELPRLRRTRPRVVSELEKDAIRLFGPDVTRLLRKE
jgi:predicted nucleotidyltransferase